MSGYTRTILALAVANACLVLFLTYGAVFPSRLGIPSAGEAMPDEYYDFTVKESPFYVPAEAPKQVKAEIPVISARSLPLLSRMVADPESAEYATGEFEYPIRAGMSSHTQWDLPSGSSVELQLP
jgi:hypothetical protein